MVCLFILEKRRWLSRIYAKVEELDNHATPQEWYTRAPMHIA